MQSTVIQKIIITIQAKPQNPMSTKTIEPNLRLISEYTKLGQNDRFCIPEYQRGYSWTTTQCDKLWQDIERFIDTGAEDPYFFGTVIIDCSTSNCLSLIDGQQRTTTFLLLLKAISLRIKEVLSDIPDEEETRALKKGLNSSLDKIFEILYKADDDKSIEIENDWNNAKGIVILENRSINELYKNDFQAIIEAETFENARTGVYKIPRKQKDNKYTNFFRNFQYFYEKLSAYTETKINLFAKIFLTRCQIIEIKSWQIEQAITMFNSLNSTGMPLSDADIISAQLYSKSDDKNAFTAQWKRIKGMADELSQRNVVDIDSVLQQFMYIERARTKAYKTGEVTVPGIRRYYTYDNQELLNEPKRLCDAYEKILLIWNKIVDYPVTKLILKFNENFKLLLIPYLFRYNADEISEERLTPVIECLLRLFAILEAGTTGFSSSKFKTFLFNENLSLVSPSYTDTNIIADFNNHINNTWKFEEIVADLKEYDKNILVFLNEYLYAKSNNITFDFSNSVNVEHIMPASGHNVDSIRADAGLSTQEDFDRLVNLLGNKILLEEDINKSISNDWFKTKKGNTVRSKRGYRESAFGLASELTHYPNDKWGQEDIELFTDKAARRIADFIFGNPPTPSPTATAQRSGR